MREPVTSVLVIEDDEDVRELVRVLLARNGYRVIEAASGRQALRTFHDGRPDLIILDVGLPDLDGWQVLERIRDMSDTPVLMLTARSTEGDKVRGLQAGADDYLTKPFGRAELMARLEAMRRRTPQQGSGEEVFDDGSLRVDMAHREVEVDGDAVVLTPIEYRLLVALVQSAGQLLTSDRLLQEAWNDPYGGSAERIKYAMLRLRRKLGWGDPRTSPIESVRGFGYRYRSPQGG